VTYQVQSQCRGLGAAAKATPSTRRHRGVTLVARDAAWVAGFSFINHSCCRAPLNPEEFAREQPHENAQICTNCVRRLCSAAGRCVRGRFRTVPASPLRRTSCAATTGLLCATLLPPTLLLRCLLRVLRASILASHPVLRRVSVLARPAFCSLRTSILGRSVARSRAPVVIAISRAPLIWRRTGNKAGAKGLRFPAFFEGGRRQTSVVWRPFACGRTWTSTPVVTRRLPISCDLAEMPDVGAPLASAGKWRSPFGRHPSPQQWMSSGWGQKSGARRMRAVFPPSRRRSLRHGRCFPMAVRASLHGGRRQRSLSKFFHDRTMICGCGLDGSATSRRHPVYL